MDKHTECGIFLLHEGLQPTILESQVLSHVAAMRNQGVNMDVWSFALTRNSHAEARKVKRRLERDHGVVIRVFRGVRPAVPGSLAINSMLFLFWLYFSRARPAFVHARTDYSTAVAVPAKRYFKFRLVWDARGDTLSEFLAKVPMLSSWKRLFAPLRRRRIQRQLERSARDCDFAIFVSSALRELQGPGLDPDRVMVLPCVANEQRFCFDEKLRLDVRRHVHMLSSYRRCSTSSLTRLHSLRGTGSIFGRLLFRK